MSRPGALWPRLILVGALLVLLGGLVKLFRDRFDTGDVYPAYSSFRGDPLGTRVLFEALHATGVDVSRNFRDLERAKPGGGSIVFAGLRWSQVTSTSTEDVAGLLDAVRSGSRAVLVFAPQDSEREPQVVDRERSRKRASDKKREFRSLARELALDARWLPAGGQHALEAELKIDDGQLPLLLPWHTALSFEPADKAWRTLYGVGRYSGILERPYGDGSIVVIGDAYLLSNEAMARARHAPLLAWVVGPVSRVVFDETHLGVVENSGVAALARRYGLGHTAMALLVVALLYLWRNGTSLVPPSEADRSLDADLAGRDASAGLVNLLRRTVPPGDLVAACVHEYMHAATWRRLPEKARRALEALAVSAPKDPRNVLQAIRSAHETLKRDH